MSPIAFRFQKTEGPSRYIIVISKKIDKRATKRNRMRRLIRESLRHLVPEGAIITCVVKQTIADYTYKEVETLVSRLLHEKSHF